MKARHQFKKSTPWWWWDEKKRVRGGARGKGLVKGTGGGVRNPCGPAAVIGRVAGQLVIANIQ